MNHLIKPLFFISRTLLLPIRYAERRFRRWLKTPRMDLGYTDSTGEQRPNTRVSDTVFMDYRENIKVGDHVYIGHYTVLDGAGGLEIAEGCHISPWVGIFTHSSHIAIRLYGRHYDEVPAAQKKAYNLSPVSIGKYTYIGAGARILPGVKIGKGCIIGSGSLVTRDIGDYQYAKGTPAGVVGDTRALDKPFMGDPDIAGWYHEWSGEAHGPSGT